MIEALMGGALGGVLRLAPELLKWFDRKDERKHELAMIDRNLAADRQRAELNIRAIEAQDAAAQNAGEIQMLVEAMKAQATPTGIGWVDAMNSLVRPLMAYYWCIVLYTLALGAQFVLLLHAGVPAAQAIANIWGEGERGIATSILSFYFVDRTLRKGGGVSAAH